ncbi:MAG: hypothetical protein ABIQ91_00035 [Candidatus Paceibacterota bacterium]
MPENEIHAPVYIKGKVATAVYPDGHAYRLYFASGSSWGAGAVGDENNWRLMEGATDHGAISGIVFQVFDRLRGFMPAGSTIKSIELWHSIPEAPNVLDHINALPPANPTCIGTPVAASYSMYVLETALRKQFRMSVFDGSNPAPQKFPFPSVPVSDDASFAWYMVGGTIPFANNDGLRLTTGASLNQGYNRKLARSYGRTISP